MQAEFLVPGRSGFAGSHARQSGRRDCVCRIRAYALYWWTEAAIEGERRLWFGAIALVTQLLWSGDCESCRAASRAASCFG